MIYPGIPEEWQQSDWIDPDFLKAMQWAALSEEERERALRLERAMQRARESNPLAY